MKAAFIRKKKKLNPTIFSCSLSLPPPLSVLIQPSSFRIKNSKTFSFPLTKDKTRSLKMMNGLKRTFWISKHRKTDDRVDDRAKPTSRFGFFSNPSTPKSETRPDSASPTLRCQSWGATAVATPSSPSLPDLQCITSGDVTPTATTPRRNRSPLSLLSLSSPSSPKSPASFSLLKSRLCFNKVRTKPKLQKQIVISFFFIHCLFVLSRVTAADVGFAYRARKQGEERRYSRRSALTLFISRASLHAPVILIYSPHAPSAAPRGERLHFSTT